VRLVQTVRNRLAVPPDPFEFPGELERNVRALCEENGGGPVLNLGSGQTRYGRHVVNLDLFPFEGVHVCGDGLQLPFRDAAFRGVLLRGVLEHVRSADALLAEVARVLRPGGFVYVEAPFLQPYHSSPHDYRRFTLRGLREVLGGRFDETRSGVQLGPGAALAWTLRETLAGILAFGSPTAYRKWQAALGWATFWIRALDRVAVPADFVANGASAFFYLGTKRSAASTPS
jgi:SAM-dependent methyltransferase